MDEIIRIFGVNKIKIENMRSYVFSMVAAFGLGLSNYAWAGSNRSEVDGNTITESQVSSVRYVKAPRFARPLVEKWIAEYAKTQPGVEFQLAKASGSRAAVGNNGNQIQDDVDLNIVLEDKSNGTKDFSQNIVYFGATAVLPITARSSEAARLLEGKNLNSKKLKQLFFINEDFDEDVKKSKDKVFESINIYSATNQSSVASSFASSFGEESSSFRGKRISGDDLFLNTALQKDPLGVSFNALSNIFDLQSRRLKSDLSLIGIDVDKNLAATFSDNGSLDDLLVTLENGKVEEVVVNRIGISFDGADEAINKFLAWVLENGVKYNHEFGLLNLDRKIAQEESQKVKSTLTAQYNR